MARPNLSPNQYRPSRRARATIACFNLAGRIALRRFERRTRNAIKANRDTLVQILKLQRATEFGRVHRFDATLESVDPVAAYQDITPLTRYADYSHYIDRIADGQQGVLTRDPVDILAGSAGTTAAGKRLPNTRRARRKFMFFVPLVQQGVIAREIHGGRSTQRGINLMSLYSPPVENNAHQPVMSANNAAMDSVRQQIPIMWSSPETVFSIGHQPTAYYLHALFGLINHHAPYIAAVFAPHLTSFFALIEKHRDQLILDIEYGSVSNHLALSAAEHQSLEAALQPDPIRARELRTEFDKGFANIVPRIWPQMRYLATVTTGSFSIYMPRLRSLTGKTLPIYTPCHAASEAIIGINLRPDRNDYVLALGGAHFEFIPLAQSDEDRPATVDINELRIGQEYEVVLTNFAGLYRYRIEDIVRITGFLGTAPTFEFLCRRSAILNLVGEKTTEYHTAAAVTTCVEKWLGSNRYLRDYSVAARNINGLPNYAFYIELDADIRATDENTQGIAARLDQALCQANVYYWSNGRKAEALGPLRINFVEPGTFETLTRLRDELSRESVTSQLKTARVINRSEHMAILDAAVYLSTCGSESAP